MQPVNRVRLAHREGRPSFGVYARIPSPETIALLAFAGLDFVRIDMIENHMSPDVHKELIRAARAEGITPFVRVPRLGADTIRAVLDMGALGIVVPEVESAADVDIAVAATKLPPVGHRRVGLSGVDGLGRVTADQYAAWAEGNVMLAVQVETRSAVEQIDAILANPGLDMVLGGRGTLSKEFGLPGQREHPRILEIEGTIMAKAKAAGKLTSVTHFPLRNPSHVAVVQDWISQGIDSLCLGTDTDLVYTYRAVLHKLGGSSFHKGGE
jgi:2-keto-3-deoxy-L-rhamnonate aldolase RhmA